MIVTRRTALRMTCAIAACGLGIEAWAGPKASEDLPDIKEMPSELPTSAIPQDGKMIQVRATSEALKKQETKPCPNCGGTGHVKTRGEGKGFSRPGSVDCEVCGGKGRLPNDLPKIETAALAVVLSIVKMDPDAKGASIALNEAYASITEHILKSKRNFMQLQSSSAAVLSQVKPQVDKMVLFKGLFASEIDHPTKKDEKIYILRLAHKKQVVAIVSPKQADPPKRGGRALIAGVIAGAVDVNKERVVILERGFLISPNLDFGWWNDE